MAGPWSLTVTVNIRTVSISYVRRGGADMRSVAVELASGAFTIYLPRCHSLCVLFGGKMPARLRTGSARHHRDNSSGRSGNRVQAARYGPSRERARPVAAVLSVAVAVALAGLVLATRSGAATGPPASPCTGQMFRAKCAAVQQAARRLPVQGPPPSAAGPAPGTAGVIGCGPAFFTPGEARRLADAFGLISCFRLAGQGQWILVGNGASTSAPVSTGTPGGAIVAVERCPAGDAACLNADATRSFSSFMVVRAPDPRGQPLELQSVAGRSILLLSNARCGLFSFDVRSLRWYRGTRSAVHALQTSPGQQRPAAVTPTMTGVQALGARPPAGPPAACSPGPGQ